MKTELAILTFTLSIIFCGCETITGTYPNPNQDSGIAAKVDEYIQAHVSNGRFNGNLLITKGDSIVYSKSFGQANREFSISNTDSTKFLIGSITKTFTAFGILLLEKKGKLMLNDSLSKYLPDFPNADKVTIKHLLTHSSGIRDYHAFNDWKEDSKLDVTPQLTISKVIEDPYIFEPGVQFSYSNSGYIILGLIIEHVSGMPFADFIQMEILTPLELENTGLITNEKIVPYLAEGYSTNPRETRKADYINYNQPYASGNMYSTVNDLWKFTKAVMHSELLSNSKTEEIFNSGERYGYGWGIRKYGELAAYGHHGGMNGFVGSITFIPNGEYFICFVTNDDNTPRYVISEDLVSIVMGHDVTIPDRVNLIELTQEMKNSTIGQYLAKSGDTLTVFENQNRLFLRETGQPAHELFPIDSNKYCFELLEFNAIFSEFHNGQSNQLIFVGKSGKNILTAKKNNSAQQRLRKHAGEYGKMNIKTYNKTLYYVDEDVFQNPHVS